MNAPQQNVSTSNRDRDLNDTAVAGPDEGLLTRPDGRVLAWCCAGPRLAPPVLWLHGSTGSRRTAPVASGVLMIAYDRPGYGASSPHPLRTLISDADDVQALLEALGLGQVSVLAFSGGAAVAYACATRLAPRIRRLGIVSGATWPTQEPPAEELLRDAADALRADPAAAVARLGTGAPPADQRVLADPAVQRMLLAGAHDAVATGTQGWVTEARLIRTAWPFQPQDITSPVLLWHGTQDQAVPLQQVLPHIWQMPAAHLHQIADAGHLGWMDNQDEIIVRLMADCT